MHLQYMEKKEMAAKAYLEQLRKSIDAGGEAQIKAYTRQLIENAGTARLILSADCSVQKDTPAEHLRWVAEASAEYMAEMQG